MISRHTFTLPLALFAVALLAPSVSAQVRGGHGFAPSGGVRSGGTRAGRRGGFVGSRVRVFGGAGFLPVPYYPYYPEENSGYWPPAAPAYSPYRQPYQQVDAPPAPPAPPAAPVEPLLMEERGGQWVRIPTGDELPTATEAQASGTSAAPAGGAQAAAKLPAAMIVFRDGHMEELGRYTIQGNVLYTNADYWTTGSWTRKIRVADLDIPATLKINEQRGAKFDLPSGPSEIMVRF